MCFKHTHRPNNPCMLYWNKKFSSQIAVATNKDSNACVSNDCTKQNLNIMVVAKSQQGEMCRFKRKKMPTRVFQTYTYLSLCIWTFIFHVFYTNSSMKRRLSSGGVICEMVVTLRNTQIRAVDHYSSKQWHGMVKMAMSPCVLNVHVRDVFNVSWTTANVRVNSWMYKCAGLT